MNDEEWREKYGDKIADVEDRIRELEITLHGKRAKTGLLAEYERHDGLLTRIYAVLWQDPTGKTGLLHDVDVLMGRRDEKFKGAQYKWQFWGLILTTLITSGTALILSWDKIIKLLPKYHPGPLEQKIEEAKRPRSPRKIYRYRVVPKSGPASDQDPENLQ